MISKKTNPRPLPNQSPENSIVQLEQEIRHLEKNQEMADLENELLKEAKAFLNGLKGEDSNILLRKL